MIPHWVGMFGSQIPSRPQCLGKLPVPQLLPAVAPVLRPTCCTLPLSMGLPVTSQPGEWVKGTGLGYSRLGRGVGSPLSPVLIPLHSSGIPASRRLQTLGVQPPIQPPSWSCSLDQQDQDIQQQHPQHPLPRTSFKGAPSPCLTLGLGLTWMWAPNQCTEPLLSPLPPSPSSSSLPPGLLPPHFHYTLPHTKWLPWASPTPLHTLISLPPPSGFKALAKLLGVQLGPASPSRLSPRCEWRGLCRPNGAWDQHSHPQPHPWALQVLPPPQGEPHGSVLRSRVFLLIKLERHQCSGNTGLMVFGPEWGWVSRGFVRTQRKAPIETCHFQLLDLVHLSQCSGSASSSGRWRNLS